MFLQFGFGAVGHLVSPLRESEEHKARRPLHKEREMVPKDDHGTLRKSHDQQRSWVSNSAMMGSLDDNDIASRKDVVACRPDHPLGDIPRQHSAIVCSATCGEWRVRYEKPKSLEASVWTGPSRSTLSAVSTPYSVLS